MMAAIQKGSTMGKTPNQPKGKALAPPPTSTLKPALTPADKGRMVLIPSVNSATVIDAYQGNVMGKDADINAMIEQLRETSKEVRGGDLRVMESMLIGQATALQTIFASLARRAASQEHLRQYETFLGLALKAQAQSRATISALVDLKYPRQATFVKQANIAHGPQQVNNGAALDQSTHAKQTQPQQNQLLEDARHGGTHLDTRATTKATRSHQAVEAVATVQRAKKSRG